MYVMGKSVLCKVKYPQGLGWTVVTVKSFIDFSLGMRKDMCTRLYSADKTD